MSETFAKVEAILRHQLGLEPDRVIAAHTTLEELKADSLDIIEVGMNIEREFDRPSNDAALDACKTVADLVRYAENVDAA